jgi:prevent-host-death family protein
VSTITEVSIGQVKRDISELVNRVAFAGERIVLTSRGKPKAVLVSLEDFELLQRAQGRGPRAWQAWLADSAQLSEQILDRRQGAGVDAGAVWAAARADLETRGDAADGPTADSRAHDEAGRHGHADGSG